MRKYCRHPLLPLSSGLATWMAWPSYFFLQVRPGIDVKGQKPDLGLEEPPQRKNGPWLFWGVVS